LVRPLLAVWREQVLAYCKEKDLNPVIDPSNLDTTIYRNRLRHELIPTLETYNPAFKEVLYRTIQVLSGEFDVLERIVDQAWASALLDEGQDYVVLDPDVLRKQPVGVRRNLLRRAIALLRPDLRDIDFDSIERGLDFLAQPSQTNQIDLVAGLRLMMEEDRLWLTTWTADLPSSWPQMTTQDGLKLELPGEVLLKAGWRLRASKVAEIGDLYPAVLANEDSNRAWVDKFRLDGHLVVRKRRPGDRFRPLGMGGRSIKLSEFMINVKMPRRARDAWPLVCAGDDIVWIPGYRLGHPFRITPETREAIYLHLVDTQSEKVV
jgi:tRNA(Ile)-lysidine synthase